MSGTLVKLELTEVLMVVTQEGAIGDRLGVVGAGGEGAVFCPELQQFGFSRTIVSGATRRGRGW